MAVQSLRTRFLALLIVTGIAALAIYVAATGPQTAESPSPGIASKPPSAADSPTESPSPERTARSDGQSDGTLTLVLDAPASTTLTAPLVCEWTSRSHVFFYDPASATLFGEEVSLYINGNAGTTPLSLLRSDLALYDGIGATFRSEGLGTAHGVIYFQNLTPNPESYPINSPLPSPLEAFTKPIGNNPAARSLDGTLTWDCGIPPLNVPDVDPTPEPAGPPGTPIVWPQAVMTVKGVAGSWPGAANCGPEWHRRDGTPVTGAEGICGGPDWIVPTQVVEVRAGATLSLAIAGYKLDPADMEVAPRDRVRYYRGGTPDVLATVDSVASGNGALSYKVPSAGDWVASVWLLGTSRDGTTVSGRFFFHLHVTG